MCAVHAVLLIMSLLLLQQKNVLVAKILNSYSIEMIFQTAAGLIPLVVAAVLDLILSSPHLLVYCQGTHVCIYAMQLQQTPFLHKEYLQ